MNTALPCLYGWSSIVLLLASCALLTAENASAMLPPRYHFAKKVGRIQSAESGRKAANTVVELKVTHVKSPALPVDARRTKVVARIPSTVTGQVIRSLRGAFRVGGSVTFTMTQVRQLAPGPARFSDAPPPVGATVTAHLMCAGTTCKKSVGYLGLLNAKEFAAVKSGANTNARRYGAQIRPSVRRLHCAMRRAAQPGMVCLRFKQGQVPPKGWQPGCNRLVSRAAKSSTAQNGPRVVCRAAPARRALVLPGTGGAIERVVDHRRKKAAPSKSPEPVCRHDSGLRSRGCVWVEFNTAQVRLLGQMRGTYERAGWVFHCAGRQGALLCRPKPNGSSPVQLPALPQK